MGIWSKPKPEPGAKEKVKLPNKAGRGKLTSYCRLCRCGVCQCAAIAKADREAAARARRPIPCGQRFASGGTCHKTVVPGESCSRDHSRC